MKTAAEFWRNVERGGVCWPWKLGRSPQRYGVLQWRGRLRGAHCVAWELTHERKLRSLEIVRHACAMRHCCNPKHLTVGDAKDNFEDAVRAGTMHQPPRLSADPDVRFWPYVEKQSNGCWRWTRAINSRTGHGVVGWRDEKGVARTKLAHRLAWELQGGDPGAIRVGQTCGDRLCVRHLIQEL